MDLITKLNIHQAMAKSVPSTYAPTPQQEAEDPKKSDQIYLAWSEHLRKLARNGQKTFPHVFKENISYGFQRNLCGLKPFAICVLAASIAITSIATLWKYQASQEFPVSEAACVCAFFLSLLFWLFAVTHSSVKQASYDYALRLIDDCVPNLRAKGPTPRRKKASETNEPKG